MDLDALAKDVAGLKDRLHNALAAFAKSPQGGGGERIDALEKAVNDLGGQVVEHARKLDEIAQSVGDLAGAIGEITAALEARNQPSEPPPAEQPAPEQPAGT